MCQDYKINNGHYVNNSISQSGPLNMGQNKMVAHAKKGGERGGKNVNGGGNTPGGVGH